MSLDTLARFFMWCTILNGGLFVFWSTMVMLCPDLTYRTQSKFWPIPRETWNVVMYSFLGLFKIVLIAFNIVPWVALSILR